MADVQELITDLKIRDNLSLGLANAKASVVGFGAAVQAETDKVSTAFGRMGADIRKGIGQGLGIGATQLAARAASEFVGFLKESAQAAIEEEAGIARLTKALEVNATAWDGNIAAVERAISAREASGFADDELRDSLGSLVAATGDVNEAFAIQSVAMDLARFKGESLSSATAELVKVQAGSFRSLKSLGIVIDANATSSEALAAIQKVVAGQTEEFANTTAGAFERAEVAVENFQEQIGAPLADAFATFTTGVLEAAKALGGYNLAVDYANAHGLKPPIAPDQFRIPIIADAIDAFTGMARSTRGLTTEMIGSSQAAALEAVKLAEVTTAVTAQIPPLTVAAEKTAGLAIAAATAAAADNALEAAAKTATSELDKQAIANLALEKEAARNVITQKALGDRMEDNAGLAPILTGKIDDLKTALQLAADQAQRLGGGLAFVGNQTLIKVPGFDNPEVTTGSGGVSLADSFVAAQQLAAQNAAAKAARDVAAASAAASAAEAAAAKSLAEAKARAQERYNRTLDQTKERATTLFDVLHQRHLQAISDTEKLAQKQHDTATQAITDALRLKLEANAAPVTAAEESQRRIELARQRRGLNESLQTAVASGDPVAIRNAQEALQSFNAQQRINALKLTQSTLDLAAQKEAAANQKTADDTLAAAKLAQAAAITAETNRDKKLRADFDKALDALKIKDKGASPAKLSADIGKLEKQFGITTDEKGFHHIADAIKTIKIPAPQVYLTAQFTSPPIFLNGRLIAAALASSQSLTATPGVRTGTLKPRP